MGSMSLETTAGMNLSELSADGIERQLAETKRTLEADNDAQGQFMRDEARIQRERDETERNNILEQKIQAHMRRGKEGQAEGEYEEDEDALQSARDLENLRQDRKKDFEIVKTIEEEYPTPQQQVSPVLSQSTEESPIVYE